MPEPIAFVTDSPLESTDVWMDHLTRALPQERIVPFDMLNENERSDVKIAIVADPDPAKLARLPRLKWVQSLWAGVEKMAAQLKDAPFEIVRLEDPEMAKKMAEAVIAWTLYLHRDMPLYAKLQHQRKWRELPQTGAFERHIGLIGLGNLGKTAAMMLKNLGFEVSGWSRSEKHIDGITTYHGEEGLDAMLTKIEIAVCLIPLTAETRHLMNASRFQYMQKDACLINFARGPIIHTGDLLQALDEDRLKHAVLDVFDEEPLSPDSPLWGHDKITVLPHISGPTNRQTASRLVASNISHYRISGETPSSMNKELGY